MSENGPSQSDIISAHRLSVKEAVGLLTSLTQAINPQLWLHMMAGSKLARQVGEHMVLENARIDQVETAGMLHDIDLLSWPGELQNKDAGLLTEKAYLQYCEHPISASIAFSSCADKVKIRRRPYSFER